MTECSIDTTDGAKAQALTLVLERWDQIGALLPAELGAAAQASGALRRRRLIRDPLVLLRLVLLYACDLSLRLVGAWAVLQDVADISAVAVLKRLRQCPGWLGGLLLQLLASQHIRGPRAAVQLCLVDATTVPVPGSQGTAWRVHLCLDLGRGSVSQVRLTDAHGGETLAQFATTADEICVADRGYAFARSLGPVLAQSSGLVVRINWHNLPLATPDRSRLDVIAWLQAAFGTTPTATAETEVLLATPQGDFRMRLVAGALPADAAERARQRARHNAQKKGHTVSAQTLTACGFVLLLTNLPPAAWPAPQVLDLYRLRWQVEVLFHRWKALLAFDALRAHDSQLVQTYLLGKLLLVVLCDALLAGVLTTVPEWSSHVERPLSVWRLTALAAQQLRQAILGPLSWANLLDRLPQLRRFLCDPPRQRPQQLARARTWLSQLSAPHAPC